MTADASSAPRPVKLLDQVADALRTRGYVAALRQAYVDWVRRYILFHQVRHPRDLGAAEVAAFLDHLARLPDLPPAAEVEARAAVTFLYEVVLTRPLGDLPTAAGLLPGDIGGSLAPRPGGDGPRLLDQLRHVLRVRHYSLRTEECYADWARRYILFHGKRHPCDLGRAHVEQFLTHLAVEGHVAESTQNQALNALIFLYKQVLDIDLGSLHHVRARRPERLPVVASRDEVRQVLAAVEGGGGLFRLAVELLYGTGLRKMECLRLPSTTSTWGAIRSWCAAARATRTGWSCCPAGCMGVRESAVRKESKSKSKIRIRKRIRKRIKSRSRTRRAAGPRPPLTLNPALNPLPNLNLTPTLALSEQKELLPTHTR